MNTTTRTAETAPLRALGARPVERLRSRSLLVDVGLVSAVALALGAVRLGAPSLWVDEAFTAQAVREHLLNPEDQYHWLYYAAITPWTLVAGTSEWALRLPSVIAAAAACALLVVLARPLFGRGVALVSGLFLATNAFVVQWSQQARSYSLVLVAGILATLLLLRAIETRSRSAWASYGLAFSLLFVLQPVSALVLVPCQVVLAVRERKAVLPHGLLAACIVLVLGVPWAFFRARQTPVDNWLDRPSPDVAARTLVDVSGLLGVGLALSVIGLVVLWRSDRGRAAWLGTWALAPFALALLVSFARPIYLDRYLITAAPAFALLAAVALFSVGRRVGSVLATAAVIAALVGLGHWYSTGSNGNWRGEGWRDAVSTVMRRSDAADAVVVAPWWAAPAATYYGASVSDVSTSRSIWVLTWSESGGEIPATERRPLGFGDHRLVERQDFGRRVSLQHWVRGS